jgi:hypothetical protein
VGKKVEINEIMDKCKVIEVFKVSWGTVVVLDFLKPTTILLGDILMNSSDNMWKITGIARSKFTTNDKYQGVIDSIYVWDCTIIPINNTDLPIIGEKLYLIKE